MFNKAFTLACILAVSVEARRVRDDRSSGSGMTSRGFGGGPASQNGRGGQGRREEAQEKARDFLDSDTDEDNQEDVNDNQMGTLESHHHNGKVYRGSKVDKKTVSEASLLANEDEDPTSKFVEWGAVQNKSWKSSDEFKKRKDNWKANNDEILKLNAES